jgi:aryl-alcohol dehydrogenase-like predicted oxidoreductase
MMKYTRLGSTGLEVSKVCIGAMSYGVPERGAQPWTLPEHEARPMIKLALEKGFNFFDTANVYSDGTSEEILGRALRDFTRRDQVVIATKVYARVRPGPNGAGLSRVAIMNEVDSSLRRLGTDYIDLYQTHRWDPHTPIEETLEALNDVVRAGKVRYIGASSMAAWQFAKALFTSKQNGWARFVSMQNFLNLLYREEEREMLPLCIDQGIALIPWSPLARGRLTRDWDETSARQQTDGFGKKHYAKTLEADRTIANVVAQIAAKRGVTRAQVALAWVLQKPGMTSPIIGASKPLHLEDAIAALSLNLTAEEIAALEAPYTPRDVSM